MLRVLDVNSVNERVRIESETTKEVKVELEDKQSLNTSKKLDDVNNLFR